MSRDPDEERADFEDAREERDAGREDDFRCHGCETPTFRGRLCDRCRTEAGFDDL